jgi:uncharacterized protein (TIGR02186 family)
MACGGHCPSRLIQALAALWMALAVLAPSPTDAQRRSTRQPPTVVEPAPTIKPPPKPEAPAMPGELPESVQADVSARSVSITSSFTGIEIVVFGAVDNSRQTSAEAGLYDVVVVLEGTPTQLVARRKSNVAGIWVNTQSITFESVPSYYAIVSTRPLDEVANDFLLREYDIGFEQVRMTPIKGWETGITTADLGDFRSSVVRLKQRDGLYIEEKYGVVFIGRSLFRASINLPANVPVGPLVTRIYLFRQGQLLGTYTTRVQLEREGIERFLYNAAFGHPILYGISTVMLAVGAGLLASTLFRRSTH